MSTMTLACGPYFDETGLVISLILFLLVKPLAYFAFIQAFRYRVSRPIPMRTSQAITLAAMRAGLGIGITALGVMLFWSMREQGVLSASWIFLYAERLFSWWFVGSVGARLRGRRLVGWVISGTLINAAFDAAMVLGFLSGWLAPAAIVALIASFIAALHIVGQRDSLKRRFGSTTNCVACAYDLTGNLSGRCPECGNLIRTPRPQFA